MKLRNYAEWLNRVERSEEYLIVFVSIMVEILVYKNV